MLFAVAGTCFRSSFVLFQASLVLILIGLSGPERKCTSMPFVSSPSFGFASFRYRGRHLWLNVKLSIASFFFSVLCIVPKSFLTLQQCLRLHGSMIPLDRLESRVSLAKGAMPAGCNAAMSACEKGRAWRETFSMAEDCDRRSLRES